MHSSLDLGSIDRNRLIDIERSMSTDIVRSRDRLIDRCQRKIERSTEQARSIDRSIDRWLRNDRSIGALIDRSIFPRSVSRSIGHWLIGRTIDRSIERAKLLFDRAYILIDERSIGRSSDLRTAVDRWIGR